MNDSGKIPTRPFPLLPFFLVVSAVTIASVAVVTTLLSNREIRDDLLSEAGDHAVRVIRHLQKDIATHFLAPTLARDGHIDLATERHYDGLDKVVRRVATSFDIANFYIFDKSGNIIYSTEREHVGFSIPRDNQLFWQASEGQVASAVRNRGAPLDLAGSGAQTSLLETYVPVSSLGNTGTRGTDVSNVIEAYQNIESLQEQVRAAQWRVTTYVIMGGVALFLVLISIVRHADRLIRRQTHALIDSNRQLAKLSRELESKVERRTQELISREKLASVGTLAAGLAHEVNNPLATISGCAEGLLRRMRAGSTDSPADSETLRYLALIQAEAFRVKDITQSLLDFSRQRVTLSRESLDIARTLEETVQLLRVGREIDGTDVQVECQPPGLRFPVLPTEFRQLLFNITRNAADAIRQQRSFETNPGGIIRWSARLGTHGLELACHDDGIGFDPAIAEQLLEPFFTTKAPGEAPRQAQDSGRQQGDAAATAHGTGHETGHETGHGTGLGLALCHTMVERHGGRLSIHSAGPGCGAQVRVHLPASVDAGEKGQDS